MRVFVKVCIAGSAPAQTYAIPCKEPAASIGLLKDQVLDRWRENNGKKSGEDHRKPDSFQLTLSGNGAVLSDKDVIQDVLQDGEFVNLSKRALSCNMRTADCNCFCTHTGPKDAPYTESEVDCSTQLPAYGMYPIKMSCTCIYM